MSLCTSALQVHVNPCTELCRAAYSIFHSTLLSHLLPHGLSSVYIQLCQGRWHPWDKVARLTPLNHHGHGSHGWVVSEATALPTWDFSTGLSTPAQTLGAPGVLQCSLMLCVREMKSISKGRTNHINGFIILIRPTHKHNWSAWQCSEAGPDQMAGERV